MCVYPFAKPVKLLPSSALVVLVMFTRNYLKVIQKSLNYTIRLPKSQEMFFVIKAATVIFLKQSHILTLQLVCEVCFWQVYY